MAASLILPGLDDKIDKFYNKPLPNNPNMTYGNVLSSDQTKLYLIGNSGELQKALLESGEMNAESLQQLETQMPSLRERVNSYNLSPIPYSLEEKFPEKAERIKEGPQTVFGNAVPKSLLDDSGQTDVMIPGFATNPRLPARFEQAQEIASYGLDPDNPYDFGGNTGTKFKFSRDDALGARRKSKEQMQYLLNKYNMKGDLSFIDPKKPELGFRYKEVGSDTYQVLNSPYIEWSDVTRQVIAEGPAILGDIALTTAVQATKPLGGKYQIPKTIVGSIGRIAGLSAAATTGTVGAEFTRLGIGKAMGAHDMSMTEIMKESQIPALIAFGGTAAVGTLQKTLPAVWESITGMRVPPEFYEYLAKLNAKYIKEEAGVPGTTKLSFSNQQLTTKEINEGIDKLGEEIGILLPKYKPTGAGVAAAGDDELAELAADFEYIFLKNATNPKYANEYAKIKNGNQDIINRLIEAVSNSRFKNASSEIDEAIIQQVTKRIDSFKDIQANIINKLRDPKYYDQEIDDTLFDVVPKKGSSTTFPKESFTLKEAQSSYLQKYQKEFNEVLQNPKYDDLRIGSTRDIQKNVSRYIDTTKTRKTIQKFIGDMDDPDIKKVFGALLGKNKTTLNRLISKDSAGKSAKANLTLNELWQLRTAMNQVRATHPSPGIQRMAGEIEESLGIALDKGVQDHIWVNKLGNKSAPGTYSKKRLDEINQYKLDNDYSIDLSNSYKNMTNAYSDSRNVLLTTLIKQGNPDKLASTILGQGPSNVASFMKVLQDAGDDGIMQIRKSIAKHIDDKILDDAASPMVNAKNYRIFFKENKDILKAIYGDDYKIMFNQNGFKKQIEKIAEYDEKILMLNSVFRPEGVPSNTPVFDIVNTLIRGSKESLESGRTKAQVRFLMNTVGDNPLLKEQIESITKRFIARDSLELAKGGDGLWKINPEKLNKLLNEGPGPQSLTGQTFEEIYTPLLGGGKNATKYVENLRLLNSLIMREAGVGPSQAAQTSVKQSTLAFPGATFIFRMFIAPLTQTGRRATAINNAFNARAGDFMAELVANPALLDDTVKYMEGKISLNKYTIMLTNYGLVNSADISEELKYYDKELKINKKTNMTDELLEKLNQLQKNIGYE